MTRTLRILGLATALATSVAGASFAAGGSLDSQQTTQSQLGANGQNQMLPRPATGSAQPGTSTYGMSGTTTNQYGNAVHTPTSPDATHPSAVSPSGGGGGGNDTGNGGSGGSR
jgi:hypothetical protein